MKLKFVFHLILAALLPALLVSCEHKELCYQHPHRATLRLVFEWQDAPDANPEGMCVFFYPVSEDGIDDGRRMVRYDFMGKEGGEVELVEGRYRVIAYNNDTEACQFSGISSFDTHRVFTRDGNLFESIVGSGALPPRANDAERIVISPDMMWGCSVEELEITAEGVTYISIPESGRDTWSGVPVHSVDRVIYLYPHELVCEYTYEVRNVENLKYATQMCGSLSGMAPSLYFGDESLGSECVTIPFAAESDGVSRITGRFYTFGHNTDNPQEHRMMFYVWMQDGGKFYFGATEDRFNVTTQVHNAPDKRHVHIIIDGLGLPTPMEGDDSFNPSVDDWQEINQDITI